MDINAAKTKILEFVRKYRYAFLVLVIGIGLMLLPEKSSEVNPIQSDHPEADPVLTMETQLEEILGQIHGAGRVEVMLSVGVGAETIYQQDEDMTVSDTTNSARKEVVTVTDGNRNETGLIRQIKPPEYLGAIIVCQGGDLPAIQLAIVKAVSKVTGLGSDRISVLKMK